MELNVALLSRHARNRLRLLMLPVSVVNPNVNNIVTLHIQNPCHKTSQSDLDTKPKVLWRCFSCYAKSLVENIICCETIVICLLVTYALHLLAASILALLDFGKDDINLSMGQPAKQPTTMGTGE
eukprot:1130055-Amphidinium_carterae.1